MFNLFVVNFIWAFSFPLIGYYLSGYIDNYFLILVRFALALLIFLPFIKWNLPTSLKYKLILIGAIQIGIMYVCYYQSFLYLSVLEVALFTIFTPFYVSIIYDIFTKRFRVLYLLTIFIAVIGAYIIKYKNISADFMFGFLLIQVSNLCFGAGQSLYKVLLQNNKEVKQIECFGYFYVGGLIVGVMGFCLFGDISKIYPTPIQWLILLYLGVIASGVAYFLWNSGACKVDSGVLAIMNNALIPLAILVNFVVWGGDIDNIGLFVLGSCLIAFSLILHYKIISYYKKKCQG